VTVALAPDEVEWRARWKRGVRGADLSLGAVSCTVCRGWPTLHFFRLRRLADCFWSASCPRCDLPATAPTDGATHAACIAAWNQRHRRLDG
jgi:hypothetical protein